MILNLFSGPDGWGEGARALALRPLGVELDEWACRTARAAGHAVVRQDVTTFSASHLRGRVEGLIASPPCTDFSIAGRRAGLEGDTGRLIFEVTRLVEECRPEWIACEQVPAVLPYWRQFARDFHAAGYSTWVEVLDAADFGVPQNRRRAVLLASRVRDVTAPRHTHAEHPHPVMFGDEALGWISMAEALGWAEAPAWTWERSDGTSRTVDSSKPAHTILGHRAPRWAYREGGKSVLLTGTWHLDTHRDQREDGSTQTRELAAPAPAITGKASGQWAFERPATTVQGTDRIAKPGHHERQWNGAIKVSLEELAVLQSFPRDYPFQGNKTQRSLQIGNAIPPRFAMHLLSAAAGVPLP